MKTLSFEINGGLLVKGTKSPVNNTTRRRAHLLAAAQTEAEGATPTGRSRRKSRPMPSALTHAWAQARAARGAPGIGESPAIAPPGSVHHAEIAKLFGRAERAIQNARRLAEDQAFIFWWLRMRPSSGVRSTSLLMDEEPDC